MPLNLPAQNDDVMRVRLTNQEHPRFPIGDMFNATRRFLGRSKGYRYCFGPYRNHRGHHEECWGCECRSWPWWFRYGVMKEASRVWHETAMGFESLLVVRETLGGDV
jgi:hypothetical protein